MNWGKSIIIAFILFSGFIITMVSLMMSTKVDLVSDNYYQQEIAYSSTIKMKEIANTSNLVAKIDFTNKQLYLQNLQLITDLKLSFYKPNDNKQDVSNDLKINKMTEYKYDLTKLSSGLWQVDIYFKNEGKPALKTLRFTLN